MMNQKIDHKNCDVSVNDTFDDNCSVVCIRQNVMEYNEDAIPFIDDVTSSTITYNTTGDDYVGNVSLATLKVYEVNIGDIEFCFHGPKIIPKNELSATI